MAFEGLTEKLSSAFKKLRNKGRLTESDVKEAMREIRLALLEADVSYKVVKDFIKGVTEKAVGAENTIAVHVRRIREKIEINPREPKYLKVVWGVGYKIEKQ